MQMAESLVRPWNSTDQTAVTLATTLKALYPVSAVPIGQYFTQPQDAWAIEIWGRFTSAVTPGNLVATLLYGTGADANGVAICSSAALALTASQTNMTFYARIDVECRSYGTTGTLFGTMKLEVNNALIASTLQPILAPATAPVVSGACDLTSQILYPNLQFSRSGSTVETAQVHKVRYHSLNV